MTIKHSQVFFIIGLVLLIVFLGFVDFQVVKINSIEYGRENLILQDQALASNGQQNETYSYACGQMVSFESVLGGYVSVGNPAAEYCKKLGHEFNTITNTDRSQNGTCSLPDRTTCDAWDFLQGKCGQSHNACAQQGLGTRVLGDGKNAFSREYAVCINERGEQISAATDLVQLYRYPGSELRPDQNIQNNGVSQNIGPIPDSEISPADIDALPASFDWRNHDGSNWVTPVRDQGICGSCWSFSAVGVTEAIYNINYNDPDLDLDLSEQFLDSDCHTSIYGYQNCCGGWNDIALEYIRDSGIPDEGCMSYVDGSSSGCSCNGSCNSDCTYRTGDDCSDTTCSFPDRCTDWASRLTQISTTGYVGSGSATIKQALIDYGPLGVSFGSGSDYGGSWDGDIYRCTIDTGTNHSVVLVGYDDAGGYWILKNSWGISFGDNGYFKLGYGECYIEQYVYYADVDYVPLPKINVTPTSIDESLVAGDFVTRTLTISNTGYGALTWDIVEEPAPSSGPVSSGDNPIPGGNSLSRDPKLKLPDQPTQQVMSPNAPMVLLNDGSFENGPPPTSAWTETANNGCEWIGDWTSVWGHGAYDCVYDYWAGGYCSEVPSTDSVSQTISVPSVGATLSFWYMAYRPDDDDPSPDDYAYVSVDGTPVWTLDFIQANDTYPNWENVTIDLGAYAGEIIDLELGAVSTGDNTGNIRFDLVDWDICTNPQDIPWLSVSPTGGTTPPDGYTLVDVMFDSTGLVVGTYSGNLCINSNDPITPLVVVPVTLDVEYRIYIPLIMR